MTEMSRRARRLAREETLAAPGASVSEPEYSETVRTAATAIANRRRAELGLPPLEWFPDSDEFFVHLRDAEAALGLNPVTRRSPAEDAWDRVSDSYDGNDRAGGPRYASLAEWAKEIWWMLANEGNLPADPNELVYLLGHMISRIEQQK